MSDSVLTGLIERRSHLVVEIRRAESALHRLLMDIEHLDATIRQFDRAYKVPSPVMTHVSTGSQVTRIILTILRKSPDPMTLRAVAVAFMVTLGLDPRNPKRLRQVTEQVRTAMNRQKKNGTVVAEPGLGMALMWRIAV